MFPISDTSTEFRNLVPFSESSIRLYFLIYEWLTLETSAFFIFIDLFIFYGGFSFHVSSVNVKNWTLLLSKTLKLLLSWSFQSYPSFEGKGKRFKFCLLLKWHIKYVKIFSTFYLTDKYFSKYKTSKRILKVLLNIKIDLKKNLLFNMENANWIQVGFDAVSFRDGIN